MFLGIPYNTSVILVGIMMLAFVLFGGMTATSWVQIIKAVLLIAGTVVLFMLVMWSLNFDFLGIFTDMKTVTSAGPAFLNPGIKYTNGLDAASLTLGLVLGTAGLPHVLVRFLTVPNAQVARKSVVWVMWILGAFHILVIFLGFGAAKLVGSANIIEASPGGNMAGPLLSSISWRRLLICFHLSCFFATILAVVSGIVVTGATAFSHDFYNEILKDGKATQKQQMFMVRLHPLSSHLFRLVYPYFYSRLM